MINVVLLGAGNVAVHLFRAFSAAKNVQVKQVYNRSEKGLAAFNGQLPTTSSIDELVDADVYILALRDDAIAETAASLRQKEGLVAHTSGAVSIEALKDLPRSGVFYPLQTFSKDQPLNYANIPFCLEAKNPADLDVLKKLANAVSGNLYEVSSEQRKKLHVSAVFVCNFVNHLYAIGEDICITNRLPFEILQPLITETAAKVTRSSPREVQTGPAVRGDKGTIHTHLELLSSAENKDIYQLLTHAIQTFHGKKL